jgi:hypothetical protein
MPAPRSLRPVSRPDGFWVEIRIPGDWPRSVVVQLDTAIKAAVASVKVPDPAVPPEQAVKA